jgi:hypothetical protein
MLVQRIICYCKKGMSIYSTICDPKHRSERSERKRTRRTNTKQKPAKLHKTRKNGKRIEDISVQHTRISKERTLPTTHVQMPTMFMPIQWYDPNPHRLVHRLGINISSSNLNGFFAINGSHQIKLDPRQTHTQGSHFLIITKNACRLAKNHTNH